MDFLNTCLEFPIHSLQTVVEKVHILDIIAHEMITQALRNHVTEGDKGLVTGLRNPYSLLGK